MTANAPTVLSPDNESQSLLSVEDARASMLAAVMPPEPEAAETVPLASATGRVLARDITAGLSMPRWPNSAMDGYAVRLEDVADDGIPVHQCVAAGTTPRPLQPNTAARIFTGAPVPRGADTVVMQEHCRIQDQRLFVEKPPMLGANIRSAAEDFGCGDTVLRAGCHLQPQHVALAASAGAAELPVQRRLRVAILITGDELAPPGSALAPGQIYESNGHMLAALTGALGCRVDTHVNLPDDQQTTRAALSESAEAADLVITSGGASVGDCDHIRRSVAAIGETTLFGIAVKPGKPLAFGRIGSTPLLALPGNPASLFVTFLLFGAPLIRRLQGRCATMPNPIWIPAGFEHTRTHERAEYMRVRLEQGRAVPCGAQSSGVLTTTAAADGLACIPPHARIAPGESLAYYPLPALLA